MQGKPVLGHTNTPIELIVVSDFECPYCHKLFQQIENIRPYYIDKGLVKSVFINYPLKSHKKAKLLAEFAQYAYGNVNSWNVYPGLFEKCKDIKKRNTAEQLDEFFTNAESFKNYLDSNNKLLQEDIKQAKEVGRKRTPAFTVNISYILSKTLLSSSTKPLTKLIRVVTIRNHLFSFL